STSSTFACSSCSSSAIATSNVVGIDQRKAALRPPFFVARYRPVQYAGACLLLDRLMTSIIRDARLDDLPAITAIYRESVLNGSASYELDPPDQSEMDARLRAITSNGYPCIAAEDAKGKLVGYAHASAFRTRQA